MSDFRIRYGLAFGPYGTASATSAGNLLTPQDATPDVSLGTFFVTNNTSALTYTYFDVTGAGGIDSTANNGKWIRILLQDNNSTFANAGQMFLSGTGGAMTSGGTIDFVFYNSGWYETGRSEKSRETVKSVTVGGTVAPDVRDVSVLIVNNTIATTLIGLSGGVVGQIVQLMKAVAAAGTTLTITGAANFMLAGTNTFVLNDSAAITLVNDGTRFRQVGGAIAP